MKTAVDDQREPGVIDRNTTQNITKKIKINQQLKNQTKAQNPYKKLPFK